MTETTLTVGLAQIAPTWLNRPATIDKLLGWINDAAKQNCGLVAFGEALVPGYPFWVARTGDGHRVPRRRKRSRLARVIR